MGQETATIKPEAEPVVRSVRALLLRLPTLDELREDLEDGKLPELRVEFGVKSDHSREKGKLTLFGGKAEGGEKPYETAIRELGEEANVFQLYSPIESRGRTVDLGEMTYRIPGRGELRELRVVMVIAPNFDKAYPVDNKEAKIGEVRRVSLSEFLSWVEEDGGDGVEMLDYLRQIGKWSRGSRGEGVSVRRLMAVQRLFRIHIGKLLGEKRGSAEGIYKEILFWEAGEYLKQYKNDELRFGISLFTVMFASELDLWDRRRELVEILEDEESKERLNSFLNFLEGLAEGQERKNWSNIKNELESRELWTGDIGGLDLKQRVDEFVESLVRVVREHGGVEASDVDVANEAKSYSPIAMAQVLVGGRNFHDEEFESRVRFEVGRWWGVFYAMMRLRGEYEGKLLVGCEWLRNFLEDVLMHTSEIVDWGEVGGRPTVRKYAMEDGREVRVVWVDGGEKSFVSFVRKTLMVGQDKIDGINDVFRMSVVVLDEGLAEEFYKDFVKRLGSVGFGWGSRKREEGKVRYQLDLREGERGRRGERTGSIADRFVEAKGYVWKGDEIVELAIWGLPYAEETAKFGFLQPDLDRYGYLEKVIDDNYYPFWRLVTMFAIFFPDSIYGEVIGRLIAKRIGRPAVD